MQIVSLKLSYKYTNNLSNRIRIFFWFLAISHPHVILRPHVVATLDDIRPVQTENKMSINMVYIYIMLSFN